MVRKEDRLALSQLVWSQVLQQNKSANGKFKRKYFRQCRINFFEKDMLNTIVNYSFYIFIVF